MGWLNFGGKKRDRAQGFGNSSKTKSRKRPKSFILEKIVTPSAGVGGWLQDFDALHQLLGTFSLPDLDLPNFFADSGVCPIAPAAPTNNLPPLIDFDPLGLYHDGIATQTPYTPGGAFETLPIALIPIDPHSPNPNNPNAIRQLLNFPLASQPLVGSIDTGVSADSPYLNYANIKKGRDYVGGDDNPLLKAGEGSEHGTFMLGIVDAINKTAPKWVGRAIDSGRWADSLVEFVDAAKASGQKNAIANLSLDLTQKNADGSVTTRYELTPAERSAIEYARQNGVMLVVAAGNDGGVMSVLGQASQEFDNIFTVGAGDINGRSIYSSYGRGLDIMADGGTIEHPGLSTVGNDLGTMAGTSVATAKVAGAASLVWAANPALNYRQVMEILKSTARDLGPVGWDDETGFGFLNTLAAVDLAKKTQPEVYRPTPWVTPGTWSGEGKVTPEERAAKGGNSIAAATVQVSTNFSDSDRVDASQPDKYYQFTVNEPGYVKWNLISLNLVSGFPTPPNVSVIKADGKPGSHIFSKGISLSSSVIGEGQTSFSGGNFYDPGTYYLRVGNGAGSTFKDYNISTQFTADRVSSFAGNIQYRTQPYYSLQDSPQSAVFSGPAVSELKNLAGVVTYDNIQVNNRIAKYGIEVNESGKFRINLNSPNGKMELSVNKFIGSEDRPVQLSGLGFSANSDGWLELELNKGRYDIEVKTPSNFWQEPDWNSTQQRLVRPYTLNATFTPNAPQPGQGKVPASAGAFDKTVVSSGVVNHYYKNGYLTVQPSGQASWYGYPLLVISGSAQVINEPVPLTDPDGNYSIQTAQNLLLISGGADLGDGVNKDQVASGRILSSIGGKDLNDFYKFSLNSSKLVNLELSQLGSGAEWSLIKDRNGNGQVDPGEVIKLGNIVTESQSLDLILGAGNYYLQIGSAAPNAASQYVVNVVATPPENEVISSYNSDYYLVQNGQRRLVPDRETLNGLGINPNTVKRFSNEDLALIPLGQPLSPLIPQWQKSIDDAANQNSLGNPVTSYWDAADSPTGTKGYGRTYDRGSVYWTAKSGAIALVGQFADAYHNPNGGSNSWLGFPTAKQWNWEGGQRIDFEGGYIYRTAKEGIRAFKYDESPWQKSIDAEYAGHKGLLGNPTTGYWDAADSPTGTKGRGQNYNYGTVLWTAKSGAIALWHGFANTYNQTGGSNGWLGFPTKGKETDSSGGQRIDFEGGYIYWTEKEGAKAYHPWETPQQNLNNTVGYDGANTHPTYVNTFNNNGGSSALGSPTGNVYRSVDNGYLQEFSGGSKGSGAIMKSGANDNSYWVGGDFWARYQEAVSQGKNLGYPTSDRFVDQNGLQTQTFQKGKIVYDAGVYKVFLSSSDSGSNNSGGGSGNSGTLPDNIPAKSAIPGGIKDSSIKGSFAKDIIDAVSGGVIRQDVGNFLIGIVATESGGNWQAGRGSYYLGSFQIGKNHIQKYAQLTGVDITSEQFLNNKDLQLKVAQWLYDQNLIWINNLANNGFTGWTTEPDKQPLAQHFADKSTLYKSAYFWLAPSGGPDGNGVYSKDYARAADASAQLIRQTLGSAYNNGESGNNSGGGSEGLKQLKPETIAKIKQYEQVFTNNPKQLGHSGDIYTGTNYLKLTNDSAEFREMWNLLFTNQVTFAGSGGGYLDHYASNGGTYHAGIDLNVSYKLVQALVGGKVVYVATNDGKATSSNNPMASSQWGTIAIYNSQLNKTFIYAHMNTSKVSEGQMVDAGQEIGQSGETGAIGVPHLHFEVQETTQEPNGNDVKGLIPTTDWRYVQSKTVNPMRAFLEAKDYGLLKK